MRVRFALSCCVCSVFVVLVPKTGSFAQDTDINRESLLARVISTGVDETKLFDGLMVVSELSRRNIASDAEEVLLLTNTFNQLSPNAWRCDIHNRDGGRDVIVGDGGFAFEAHAKETGDFKFGIMGYDARAQSQVQGAMIFRMDLLVTSTMLFNSNLVDFLSTPTLEIDSVNKIKSNSTNFVAEKVVWHMKGHGELFPNDCFGTIVWLPDNGYLIEYATFHNGVVSSQLDANSGFEFRSVFTLKDGRLLPISTTKREGSILYLGKLVNVSAANPDRDFYTAESVGLKTPINPNVWRLIWLLLGAVSLSAAIFTFRKRKRS